MANNDEVVGCKVEGCTRRVARNGYCRRHYDEYRKPLREEEERARIKQEREFIESQLSVPVDLDVQVAAAHSDEDWKRLADSLSATVKGVADGSVKASAAQAQMLKHILDRAYGKAVASKEAKSEAAGLLVLPALGMEAQMTVCPRCGFSLDDWQLKRKAVIVDKSSVEAEPRPADSVSR